MAGEKKKQAAPGIRRQVGNAVQPILPTTVGVRRQADQQYDDYMAKGQTGRAVGAQLAQAVTVPSALLWDTVGNPLSIIAGGVKEVASGALGFSGDATTPAPAKQAAAKPAAKAKPKAATAKERPLSPSQLRTAAGLNVFGRPWTLREAQIAGGLVADDPKPAKFDIAGQAYGIAQGIYDNQIKGIAAAKAAGEIDLETARTMTEKATTDYFNRAGGLAGFDPQKDQLAQMMAAAQLED